MILRLVFWTQRNICLEKLVSTGSLWLIPNWMISPFKNYFIPMGKSFIEPVFLWQPVPWWLAICKTRWPVFKTEKVERGCGLWLSHNRWQTSGCLPTKGGPSSWEEDVCSHHGQGKENCGHQQDVCVFWQNNRSMVALRFVGGCLVLQKAERRNTPTSWGRTFRQISRATRKCQPWSFQEQGLQTSH